MRSRTTRKGTIRNEASSRSHAIFLLPLSAGDGDGDKTASGTASGTIMLIDTAGQEEVDQQSRADPAEVTSINISLADLGRCLKLLWEQRRRGPVAARATEF